jgi:hypothetical protein
VTDQGLFICDMSLAFFREVRLTCARFGEAGALDFFFSVPPSVFETLSQRVRLLPDLVRERSVTQNLASGFGSDSTVRRDEAHCMVAIVIALVVSAAQFRGAY